MKNKKIIAVIILIVLIILTIFLILYYKNSKTGNTSINKSEEQIVQDILNISKYKAKVEITVETNKNKTKYIATQELDTEKRKQEILEPENLRGLVIEYKENKLKLYDAKINLTKIYENYESIVDNNLWMTSFITDYKEQENEDKRKVTIEEEQILLEVKSKTNNPYSTYKKLYIDKKTAKPTKLIIQDVNQKTLVYILYNEIEIS